VRAQPTLLKPVGARTMATEAQLKARIKTVGNIQKITKAMKMVAAAKMRSVQALLEDSRAFAEPMENSWNAATFDKAVDDTVPQGAISDDADSKVLVVPIASDRGLCGAVNSYINKRVKLLVAEMEDAGKEVHMFPFGEKAKAGLERVYADRFVGLITDVGKQKAVTFKQVCAMSEHVLKQDVSEINFVFNEFKSAIAYETHVMTEPSLVRAVARRDMWADFDIEGGEEEVLESLYEFRTAVRLYHYFIESATSEQSARMSAMDNSSKNAGEMLGKLHLQYNRTRQAKITTELIEIISGAAAAEAEV
jgi:F-type H+-transporting ATPase subunit gamma